MTAELISDFEDYDIGDGQPHRERRASREKQPQRH